MRNGAEVVFTDKDVKLHFAFERLLANQIREALRLPHLVQNPPQKQKESRRMKDRTSYTRHTRIAVNNAPADH